MYQTSASILLANLVKNERDFSIFRFFSRIQISYNTWAFYCKTWCERNCALAFTTANKTATFHTIFLIFMLEQIWFLLRYLTLYVKSFLKQFHVNFFYTPANDVDSFKNQFKSRSQLTLILLLVLIYTNTYLKKWIFNIHNKYCSY